MSATARRLLNLEHWAARVTTVEEFLELVRYIFKCADQTVSQPDCTRFKEAVIEALAREMKIDEADLRDALLGVEI